MIVAIDGPAGSGKSTLSWELARRIHFSWLGTGLLYRALAAQALAQELWPAASLQKLERWVRSLSFEYEAEPPRPYRVHVNGSAVSRERLDALVTAQAASELSRLATVRRRVTDFSRTWARGRDVVAEGRDTASVIFPGAEIKVFLTCALGQRAERRFLELSARRIEVTREHVLREVEQRDSSDSNRPLGALRQVRGAQVLDSTGLTPAESIDRLLSCLRPRRPKQNLWYALVRFLCWGVGKLCFGLTVEGRENIPSTGGFILASNHRSYLDPCLLAVASGRQLTFLARDTLFKNAGFSWLIRSLHAIPLKRDASDREGLDRACRALAKGAALVMFPEGTRVTSGSQPKLKAGVGFLQARTHVPIVPARIQGSEAAWRKGARFLRPAKIRVFLGPARSFLRAPDGGDGDPEALTRAAMAAIESLCKSQPL